MSATVSTEELRLGMFIHLDLGWWAHPFALSSFQLTTPEQIASVRGLGLTRLRWSPEKSLIAQTVSAAGDEVGSEAGGEAGGEEDSRDAAAWPAPSALAPAPAPLVIGASADDAASAQHRRALAAQQAAAQLCQRQYGEAAKGWAEITATLATQPVLARDTAQDLTQALLSKLMVDQEICIRVLSEGAGDHATLHALNVAVVSLLMGRSFGFGQAELTELGVGALLHDIGKFDLALAARHANPNDSAVDQLLYRSHVATGLLQAQRMQLSAGATAVIAQHHEMVDGSGFPQRLQSERMAAAARIVALVNCYDNLCNPLLPHLGLTPHEAVSLMFAQSRKQFDATMLNGFIRMMGVYPPGSVVQLTDDRYALVVNVNSSRPLKPRVLVAEPGVAVHDALLLNLDLQPDLGVRRSIRASALPEFAQACLSPRQRLVYFFEPAAPTEAQLETR